MPTKKKAQSYLRKPLGKKGADAILKKVDQMAKKGVPASVIEKFLVEELENHIYAQVIPALNRGIRSTVPIINSGCHRIINSSGKPGSPGPGSGAHSKSK